jgi:hypothetical protein
MRRSIYLAKLSGLLSYFVYSEFFGVRAAGACTPRKRSRR